VDFAIPFPLAAALNSLSGIKIPVNINLGVFACNSCLIIYIRFLLITSNFLLIVARAIPGRL
jgi:hypothetical protein